MINPIGANLQCELKQQQLFECIQNDILVTCMATSRLYSLTASLFRTYRTVGLGMDSNSFVSTCACSGSACGVYSRSLIRLHAKSKHYSMRFKSGETAGQSITSIQASIMYAWTTAWAWTRAFSCINTKSSPIGPAKCFTI